MTPTEREIIVKAEIEKNITGINLNIIQRSIIGIFFNKIRSLNIMDEENYLV
tara:strand:- start:236 stop:391 length:156 start_codon:yes stop_codon:yes gene_type:complete